MRHSIFLRILPAMITAVAAAAAAGCGGGAGAGMTANLSAPGDSAAVAATAAAAVVQPLVQGRIVFSSAEQAVLSDATVDIHLVDSSGQPARLVAGQRMHDVAYEDSAAAGNGLPFVISGRKPAANGTYFVSVRIDTDGDGKMGSGDYRSQDTRLPAADLSQSPGQVTVAVEKVP